MAANEPIAMPLGQDWDVQNFIRARTKVDLVTQCWSWQPRQKSQGYGLTGPSRLTRRLGTRLAHRISYLAFIGPIPEGLQLDHLCRNRACVNPSHLEPVTIRENLLRGLTINAFNAHKSFCANGHPFDATNTAYVWGNRMCRACHNDGTRRARVGNQLASVPLALHYNHPWSSTDNDRVLAARPGQLVGLARELGRTYYAIMRRRALLIRRANLVKRKQNG